MTLDGCGTEGRILYDGFSSGSSEQETTPHNNSHKHNHHKHLPSGAPKRRQKQQPQQPQQKPTRPFAIARKKRRIEPSRKQLTSFARPSNSSNNNNNSNTNNNSNSNTTINTINNNNNNNSNNNNNNANNNSIPTNHNNHAGNKKTRQSFGKRKQCITPNANNTTNGNVNVNVNVNNNNPTTTSPNIKRHKTSILEHHHHHHNHHLSAQDSRSAERFRTMEAVARLPPPQHQESDDTTTSTTRHLHTNNTTTTEITSNVHLKRRADPDNVSICSDKEQPPQHEEGGLIDNLQRPHFPHENHPRRHSFIVEAATPFLSLIEGIEVNRTMEKYVRRVVEGRPYDHPQIGRMMELPGEAILGQWTAEIQTARDDTGYRIILRHHSRRSLGCLKKLKLKGTSNESPNNTNSNEKINDASVQQQQQQQQQQQHLHQQSHRHHNHQRHNFHNSSPPIATSSTAAASGAGLLTVSTIHPALNRVSSIEYQGIVSSEQLADSFIGSLSVVSFDGFTSTSDMNSRVAEVSSFLLKRVEKKEQQYPCLLGVQNPLQTTIGVSALCGFSLEMDYNVWIAQDESLPGNPVVALDLAFSMSRPDQISGLLSNTKLAETNEEEEDDPFRLTEQRLKAHTLSVRSTPYDPFQRLWGNNGGTSNNTKKRPIDMIEKTQKQAPPAPIEMTPSCSLKRKKKPTIKIRNAAAIFARANEMACKQAAIEKDTTPEPPRGNIPMVTPRVPVSPHAGSSHHCAVPSFAQKGAQNDDNDKDNPNKSNSKHNNNRNRHSNSVNGSSDILCDDAADAERDNTINIGAAVVTTQAINNHREGVYVSDPVSPLTPPQMQQSISFQNSFPTSIMMEDAIAGNPDEENHGMDNGTSISLSPNPQMLAEHLVPADRHHPLEDPKSVHMTMIPSLQSVKIPSKTKMPHTSNTNHPHSPLPIHFMQDLSHNALAHENFDIIAEKSNRNTTRRKAAGRGRCRPKQRSIFMLGTAAMLLSMTLPSEVPVTTSLRHNIFTEKNVNRTMQKMPSVFPLID